MNKIPKKLILFDIDGTLVYTGGAGTRSMNLAFKDLFGVENAFKNIPMAGKTDIQIIKDGLKAFNLSYTDGNVTKMKKMYLDFLRKEINNPLKSLHPGIGKALDLIKDVGMTLGLLTGNLIEGAKIKLEACGIYDYFPEGAFGSDHEDRDELLPIAINKFSRKGFNFSPKDCIVIGDTPRDVQCARVHGAYSIAVATGPYSKTELLNTEADLVLVSLEDTSQWINFIQSA